MKKKVYQVWVGGMYYNSFPTKIQAVKYVQQLIKANPSILAHVKEGRV